MNAEQTMATYQRAQAQREAEAAALSDADLAGELADYEAQSRLATCAEDDLSELGYAWLFTLQAEARKRQETRCPCCLSPAPGLASGAICAACAGFPLD